MGASAAELNMAYVKGVYDFGAELTCGEDLLCGAPHNSAAVAERIAKFLDYKGLKEVQPYSHPRLAESET